MSLDRTRRGAVAVDLCSGEDCWVCKLEQRSVAEYEQQHPFLPAPRQSVENGA